MDRLKISLVVGNGFSISFGNTFNLNRTWNSQQPLNWPIICPVNKHPFLHSLPKLKTFKENHPEIDDFDLFKHIETLACQETTTGDACWARLQARHFLAIAFSHYSLVQQEQKYGQWEWFRWVRQYKANIFSAYSLNYDLLLESIFCRLKKHYFSFFENNRGYGIPLVKPHGSVDFEIHPNSFFLKILILCVTMLI